LNLIPRDIKLGLECHVPSPSWAATPLTTLADGPGSAPPNFYEATFLAGIRQRTPAM
jgi:hypothetical protein